MIKIRPLFSGQELIHTEKWEYHYAVIDGRMFTKKNGDALWQAIHPASDLLTHPNLVCQCGNENLWFLHDQTKGIDVTCPQCKAKEHLEEK